MRKVRPDLALSSDFIVGFPGESDADFAESLRLITDIGFAQAYSFKYSARPGTPAAGLDDAQVPEAVMTERLASLQQLLNAQQVAFNEAAVGRTMAGSARPHRQAARPAHGPKPLYAIGAGERAATPCRNRG